MSTLRISTYLYNTIHTIPTYGFRYLFRNVIIILNTVHYIYIYI